MLSPESHRENAVPIGASIRVSWNAIALYPPDSKDCRLISTLPLKWLRSAFSSTRTNICIWNLTFFIILFFSNDTFGRHICNDSDRDSLKTKIWKKMWEWSALGSPIWWYKSVSELLVLPKLCNLTESKTAFYRTNNSNSTHRASSCGDWGRLRLCKRIGAHCRLFRTWEKYSDWGSGPEIPIESLTRAALFRVSKIPKL